jgi:hypothetical protein
MTICLAAIAKEDQKEYIVFATDHMVSTGMGDFEHSSQKYRKINDSTVAMLAGNPLLFDELIKVDSTTAAYEKLKDDIYKNFQKKRKEIIEREILNPLGIDQQFILQALGAPHVNPHMNRILDKILEYNLATGILLIGFDGRKEAQITAIDQDNMADYRAVNFHAIGSGFVQAINTLLFQKHSKDDPLCITIYNVYKAKRNAEVLQGVGKETDLLILAPEQGCIDLNNNISLLGEVYNEELSTGKNSLRLKALKLEGIGCL